MSIPLGEGKNSLKTGATCKAGLKGAPAELVGRDHLPVTMTRQEAFLSTPHTAFSENIIFLHSQADVNACRPDGTIVTQFFHRFMPYTFLYGNKPCPLIY